ncbi:MAG TPA: Ig-like domain-containing protein [bacterium]|nr:Ig-like domain-containing protein [bacterium]
MKIFCVCFAILFIISGFAAVAGDAPITGLSGWNIFLDPGHSQKENMGIFNYSEAEKNLRVALHLRDLLLTNTDIDTVYLSRTNDTQVVSLDQRTTRANSLGAAWFHSIHSDAGSPTNNSTLLLWGQYRDGREKVPNGGKGMSDIMIGDITRAMRTYTVHGSIGDCSFYGCTSSGPYLHVNRASTMPSELSEAGFHTNPTQNQRNMNAEWKKLEARAFYWSILDFHGVERPFFGVCAGIVNNKESGEPVNGARLQLGDRLYVTDTYESLFRRYSNDPTQLANGFYYFADLGDSVYTLVVEAEDFYSDSTTIKPKSDFFTFFDIGLVSRKPPLVVDSQPAIGAVNYPAWNSIVIDFSRPMDPASTEAAFSSQPPMTGRFAWSQDRTRLTFTPDTLAFETFYQITIDSTAVDAYGHALDGNGDGTGGDSFILTFQTGPADMHPPVLESVYPIANSRDNDRMPIVNLIFDEEIDPASIQNNQIALERFTDRSPVEGAMSHAVVNGRSILTFFSRQILLADENYLVRIEKGLRDLRGNEAQSAVSYRFRTGLEVLAFRSIDNFEAGLGAWWTPQASGSTTGMITDLTGRAEETVRVNRGSNSSKAMRLDYGWDEAAGEWLIREYLGGGDAKAIHFIGDRRMQAVVFGDGSGNLLRFAVDDRVPAAAASNHEVSPWFVIDWLGWRVVSWDMATDGTGEWLGDGSLDGTLAFDSIHLSHVPGAATKGSIVIDDLRLAHIDYTRVDEGEIAAPQDFALLQNYPNPFNAETVIRFHLPQDNLWTRIAIYNLKGERVTLLHDGVLSAGSQQVRWDGTDDSGRAVSSGVYLLQLHAGPYVANQRLILLK